MLYSQAPSTLRRRNLKNAAYFLQLGLPSTLIRHENGAFGKRFSNRTNLKTPALRLNVDRKHFENGAFRKRWHHDDITMTSSCDFPDWIFLKHKSKMTSDCCVFKFLLRSVDGKDLMRFHSRFQILRLRVDGPQMPQNIQWIAYDNPLEQNRTSVLGTKFQDNKNSSESFSLYIFSLF